MFVVDKTEPGSPLLYSLKDLDGEDSTVNFMQKKFNRLQNLKKTFTESKRFGQSQQIWKATGAGALSWIFTQIRFEFERKRHHPTCLSGLGAVGSCQRAELFFFCQVLAVYIIICTRVCNLTVGTEPQSLWITLLSTSPVNKVEKDHVLPEQ